MISKTVYTHMEAEVIFCTSKDTHCELMTWEEIDLQYPNFHFLLPIYSPLCLGFL